MAAGGGSGLSGIPGMMRGAAGGPVRRLDLPLGSAQASGGPPAADHLIPPGMNTGQAPTRRG